MIVSLLLTDNAPTAAPQNYAALENATLTIAGPGVLTNASDPDGDSLTASVVSQPSHGALTLHGDGSFNYTPTTGYAGPDSFTYKASDGALAATATVSLTVNAATPAPAANADSYGVLHDRVLTVNAASGVLANDTAADGNPLRAVLAGGPAHGTVALHGDGSFAYAPTAGYTGADTFQYVAFDGLTSSSAATVTITVSDPNAPTAAADSYTVGRNNTLRVSSASGVLANDTDADNDPLAARLMSGGGPAHGTLALNADGSFVYTPAAGYLGTDSFQYRAGDGVLASAVATATIAVTDHAPVARNDAYSVLHDTTLVVPASGVLANDSDPDGDPITASVVAAPQHGSLALNADGSFRYTPAAGYVGADSFTYAAGDGLLTSNTATVAINVKATDTAPAAANTSYTLPHDTGLAVGSAGGVLAGATDADGDPLLATLVSGPSHGTVALGVDGSFHYTPNTGYFGADAFTYQAFDGTTYSAAATAALTVRIRAKISYRIRRLSRG